MSWGLLFSKHTAITMFLMSPKSTLLRFSKSSAIKTVAILRVDIAGLSSGRCPMERPPMSAAHRRYTNGLETGSSQ